VPETVLAVAAHPDDEILGVGATLARHAAHGDVVHILILADGATARDPEGDPNSRPDEVRALREATRSAAGIIGAEPPRFAGLPDNRMDSIDLLEVIKSVEQVVSEVRPGIVYTHHGGDLNVDHRITHEAVITACRPLPDAPVRAIYGFETLSSTEWASPDSGSPFRPQLFVDVTDQLETKLEALAAYAMEMRPFPHPRSAEAVTALARLRGATAGVAAAEAFHVLRELR
jgi:LmbE family N-acetylglucosaminyl deacetylase